MLFLFEKVIIIVEVEEFLIFNVVKIIFFKIFLWMLECFGVNKFEWFLMWRFFELFD